MQGSNVIGLTSFIPTIGGGVIMINGTDHLLLLMISIISIGGGSLVLLTSLSRLVAKRIYRS